MKNPALSKIILIVAIIAFIPSLLFAQKETGLLPALKKAGGDIVGVSFLPGSNFAIVLSRKTLLVVDKSNSEVVDRHDFKEAEYTMRLDVGDVDSDGFAEVVVTSFSSGELSSYIFRYNGSNLENVSANLSYFFRMINKDNSTLLLAQRSISSKPFSGAVSLMAIDGKKVQKSGELDIPKNVSIYNFAPSKTHDAERVWVSTSDGKLRLYEKMGKKWKSIYKTSEKYRGNVNCLAAEVYNLMHERVQAPICVSTPPLVIAPREAEINALKNGENISGKFDEMIVVSDHKFLLGGVILDPSIPQKGFVNLLFYDDLEGVSECKVFGPYQGFVAGYYLNKVTAAAQNAKKGEAGKSKNIYLNVLINSGEAAEGRSKIVDLDITNVDCRGDF